ncbi:MAG: naringenin-chalcone synthase [Chlamydiae bacterium CG10_big_fil_rev_8_21_14_0_10_42_34]|nr:MAG: naringenin-chalcone synthase [Chlamydiae bacterium CG10_big_fil_rev_8_21_14_0_10_42_34]
MLLADFQLIRPSFESTQEETLNWLVDAHVKAEGNEEFRQVICDKLWHVGCKPDRIAKRGHVLSDFLHRDWDKMDVYQLNKERTGRDLTTRAKIYEVEVEQIFDQYYPEGSIAPDDIIHVSCTGYVSPSGAQKIVSKRNWGQSTTVTHAYHMGCYGSIPAIRMGSGFLLNGEEKRKIDIVHTEVCSLHSNPLLHQIDQLVSQSLFADGFMKYSIVKTSTEPHIKVIKLKEEIIPNSTKAMTWNVVSWGFQMSLAKELPVLITRHLPGYLTRLGSDLTKKALFAIHPGGPKILVYIQELLGLSDEQMRFSFQVLKEYGNMSSATLPHVWQKILSDETIPNKTPIVSLAFGPGLTIAGALMEKVCGS